MAAAPESTFGRGAIVRVKLFQFLTYEAVEFRPGPRLNVVMGPNGTGKSSIVMAIAVGLGAAPKALGRADTLSEFILTGRDVAVTELELLDDEATGKTRTIERRITRSQRGTSKWKIDGKSATEPQVKELVENDLKIQIGNLCTFLPQEKVGEFSAFDDVGLLKETEKALGGQDLVDQHESLIKAEKAASEGARRIRTAAEELEDCEKRLKELEPEQARLERRQRHVEKARLCEQRLAWVTFEEKRALALEAKDAKKEAVARVKAADDLTQPLRDERDGADRLKQQAKHKYDSKQKGLSDAFGALQRDKKELEKKLDDLESEKDSSKNAEQRADRSEKSAVSARKAAETATRALEALGNVDVLGLKRRVNALKPAKAQAEAKARRARDAAQDATDALTPPKRELIRCQQALQKVSTVKLRQQTFERAHGTAGRQAIALRRWLDQNSGKFRKPVLGPIALETDIEDDGARCALEHAVGAWIWTSFVCQSKVDYDSLYAYINSTSSYGTVNLQNAETLRGKGKCLYDSSKLAQMKKFGVRACLDSFVEAPPAVLEILYAHHQIHNVVLGDHTMEANIQRLEPLLTGPSGYLALAAAQDGPNPKHQIISRFQAYVSRYGAKDTTVATTKRRYASEKLPPLDSGDDGAKDTLEKDVAQAQRALDAATKTAERLEKESDEAQCAADDETKRVASSGKELAAYNSAIRNRDSSAEKAMKHEAKAKKERAECAKLKASQTRKLEQRLEAVTKVVQTCAAGGASLHSATATVAPALAERDFARDLASKAAEALQDKEQETLTLQDAAKKAMAVFDALKNEARGLKDKAEDMAPQDDAILMAQLEELPSTSAEVEAILDAERKEASQIHEDRGLQKRVEELQAKRDDLQGKVDNMEGADQQRQDALAQLKGPWESTLRNALTSLKAKFADYMDTLGARGDVELVEQATFARWGLAIKVAFRDACDLRQLDARVQSGGERSVSTIMYLMALQALLPSPFRVVDEINQGMDETNERIVFRRVVLNSTGAGAPQYWLITPKLLQGLYDMEHPDVRALVVYNGAYNVKRPADWDLSGFLDKKRRAVAAG